MKDMIVWSKTFRASESLEEAKSEAYKEAEANQSARWVVYMDYMYFITSEPDLALFEHENLNPPEGVKACFARSW